MDGVHPVVRGDADGPRWLVRFGYDGREFDGWARQPGRRTIEGTLRAGLVRTERRGTGGRDGLALDVASRTDRGVSARANALALRSELTGSALLRRLNGISTEIWFVAARPIPDDFRVRRATRRVYRYWDADPVGDLARYRDGARLFQGPIDARSFGRGLPASVPHPVVIDGVTISPIDGGRVIEVRARSFVWGMVRKIVGALREYASGRLPRDTLRAATEGRARLTLPMAEPEALVLWDVEYGVDWPVLWDGPSRYQRAADASERRAAWVRRHVRDAQHAPD